MRMRAFKSHGMNRVICRAVSHGVNDFYKNRQRQIHSNNTIHEASLQNSEASTTDGVMGSVLLIILIILGIAIPKFGAIMMILIGLGLGLATYGFGCLIAIIGFMLLAAV